MCIRDRLKYSYTRASKKDKDERKKMIAEIIFELAYQKNRKNVFEHLVASLKNWVFTVDEIKSFDFELVRFFIKNWYDFDASRYKVW